MGFAKAELPKSKCRQSEMGRYKFTDFREPKLYHTRLGLGDKLPQKEMYSPSMLEHVGIQHSGGNTVL